ncbi:hypothetical protein C7T68_09815 [Neisseria gonorrhoeae]
MCKDWYQQKACRQTGFFPFSVFRFPFSVFRFPFSVFRFPFSVFSLFYSMSKYAVIPTKVGI